MKQSKELYDILPYQGIEDNTLILRDGRVAVGFEVTGIEPDSWTATDYDMFVSSFRKALEVMPEGLDIIKTDIYYHEKPFAEKKVHSSLQQDGFFVGKTIEMFSRSNSLKQQSYLFLTLHRNGKDDKGFEYKTLHANLAMGRTPLLLKGVQEQMKKINDTANEFRRYFARDILLRRLKDDELNRLVFNYLNLDFGKQTQEQPIACIDFSDKRFMTVGQKKVRILTLKKTQEDTDSFGVHRYGGEEYLPQFTTSAVQNFFPHPHINIEVIKVRKKVEERFGLEKIVSSSNISFKLIDDFKKRADVIHEIIDDCKRANNPLILYSQMMIVWEGEGSDIYEEAKTAMTEIGVYREETFDTANLFFSGLPAVQGDIYRDIVMPLSEGVKLIGFPTNYTGDETGDLYTDRLGNPIRVDFFHDNMHAKNALVVGPTGSGKSFTMGYQILSAYSRGDIQVLIDKGRTYYNAVSALGGKYYEYSEDTANSLSFNPFLLEKDKKGNYHLTAEKIEFFITLLEVLWKQTEQEVVLSKEEKALLQQKLKAYYKAVKELPSLSDFVEYVKHHSDTPEDEEFFNVRSFVLCMQPYTTGLYKNLFGSQEITRLDEHTLLCFEMEGIANNKSLFTLLTLLIIELVMDFLRGYPDKRKHLIIDEAWALFGGEMGGFMEYVYRTIRKMNGRGVVITQSAADLEKSPIGDVLVGNSYLFMVLNHGGKSTQPLEKVLNFSSEETLKVRSMRKESERENIGRELFIKRDGVNSRVYSLKVPHEVIPILTSKPTERDYFNKLVKTLKQTYHKDMEALVTPMQKVEFERALIFEAINKFVEDKEKGLI